MDYDDLVAKLALDIEARLDRDQREANAWKIQQMNSLKVQEVQNIERLGIRSIGTVRDFDQKRAETEKVYQKRQEEAEATHNRLRDQLADGKLYHVWVDAEDEKKFDRAKILWDAKMKDRLFYGKTLNDLEISDFEKLYGSKVVSELKKSTARELQQQAEAEQKIQTEKQERARQHEAEQALQQEKNRIEEKRHDMRKNGMSMTFDTDPTPERKKNPLDRMANDYLRLIEANNRQQRRKKPSEILNGIAPTSSEEMDGGMGMS